MLQTKGQINTAMWVYFTLFKLQGNIEVKTPQLFSL